MPSLELNTMEVTKGQKPPFIVTMYEELYKHYLIYFSNNLKRIIIVF